MPNPISTSKKRLILFACALSVLALTCALRAFACIDFSHTSGTPNPFEDCQTMDEAKKVSGFAFTVPEKAGGYEQSLIQASKDLKLVQVFYGDNAVLVRKAKGSVENLDGDYNEYPMTRTIEVDGIAVTVEGESEDAISVATWSNGGYSYAITAKDAALTQSAVTEIVKAAN